MKSSSKQRPKFKYQAPTKESVKKRANQSGGMYDSIFKSGFSKLTFKEGDHTMRLCPATWEGADHYGFDVWIHSNVGADNGTYLCKKKMGEGECVHCQEEAKLRKADEIEAADELRPYRRVLVWAVDRDDEETGPQPYPMPWTLDRDISSRAVDKKTGELYMLDHPEEGYDVDFTIRGSKRKTKYESVAIARRSTPLCDDERTMQKWLEYITANPLPSILNYYDDEYLAGVQAGTTSKKAKEDDDEDDEDEKPSTRHDRGKRRDDDDDEDEKPKGKSRAKPDDDDEEEEDEEDEKPRGKGRASKPADDDDDDDDDDDEEDEKPKGKGKRSAKDDDDDEEDEEDEKPKGKAGARARINDPDAELDDDDDDDEEEEDEKPKGKAGKGKGASKPADDDDDEEDEKPKGKKPADDDDEDEDEEDDEEEEEKPRGKDRARVRK